MSAASQKFRRADSAESSAIATALMAGIAVALVMGGSLVANQIYQAADENSVGASSAAALARVNAEGRHELGLQTGELLADDTTLTLVIDGVQSIVPLSWFLNRGVIDDTWAPGEWLCLVGPADNCYQRHGNRVAVSINSPSMPSIQLGLLSASNAAPDDIVRFIGTRAAYLIDDIGNIVLQAESEVFMQVIGTEITQGTDGPDIPVWVKPSIDGGVSVMDVFGGLSVTPGNVYNFGDLPPGTILGAEGRATLGTFSRTYDSWSDSPHVLTMRDGDAVPTTPAYSDQVPITELLGPYTEMGTDDVMRISLDDNEVMFLYEFTDNLASSAADFQDLVVVFTIDPLPLQGLGLELPPEGASTLVCYDTPNGPVTTTVVGALALAAALLAGAEEGPCADETSNEVPDDEEMEELEWTLCHTPPDRPDKAKTLTVGDWALASHLWHGDVLGPCGGIL